MLGGIVFVRHAVRVGEEFDLLAQVVFDVFAALADFVTGLLRRQAGQDGVRHRVGANVHALGAQAAQLRRPHHQCGRRVQAGLGHHGVRDLVAPRRWQVAHFAQQACDGLLARAIAGGGVRRQAEVDKVELGRFAGAHCFDQPVVPHAATVEKAGRHEEGGRQPQARQDGRGNGFVVGITVVEGDAQGARRQHACVELRHRLRQRQHVEPVAHPAHLGFETRGVGLVGAQRVGLGENAVEDQDAEAAAGAGGRGPGQWQ